MGGRSAAGKAGQGPCAASRASSAKRSTSGIPSATRRGGGWRQRMPSRAQSWFDFFIADHNEPESAEEHLISMSPYPAFISVQSLFASARVVALECHVSLRPYS